MNINVNAINGSQARSLSTVFKLNLMFSISCQKSLDQAKLATTKRVNNSLRLKGRYRQERGKGSSWLEIEDFGAA